MESLDTALLRLLQADARTNVSELARQLKVSRATVQEHMARLERKQVIQGYTIRYHPEYKLRQVNAHVMISMDTKLAGPIARQIECIKDIDTLQTISGAYDLLATVKTDCTQSLGLVIDQVAEIKGVEKTLYSVILSTKFQR